jgi:hypothetical protein
VGVGEWSGGVGVGVGGRGLAGQMLSSERRMARGAHATAARGRLEAEAVRSAPSTATHLLRDHDDGEAQEIEQRERGEGDRRGELEAERGVDAKGGERHEDGADVED